MSAPVGYVQGTQVYTWEQVERELLEACESPRWGLHCSECAACVDTGWTHSYDGNPGVWYRVSDIAA